MSNSARTRFARPVAVAALGCLALAGIGLTAGAANAAEPGAQNSAAARSEQAATTQQYTVNNHTNKTMTVSIMTAGKVTYSADLAPGDSQTFIGDFTGTNILTATHNGSRLLYGAVVYNVLGWQNPQFPYAMVDFNQSSTGIQAMLDIYGG